jgi:hypothetical protein
MMRRRVAATYQETITVVEWDLGFLTFMKFDACQGLEVKKEKGIQKYLLHLLGSPLICF